MGKLSCFLAGLGAGAVIGILYAPTSGEEAREAIRARTAEGRDYVVDQAQKAREQAGEWVDRGRQIVNDQKQNFRDAYETGRQAYQETSSPKTGTNA